jgi:hypothetical protein
LFSVRRRRVRPRTAQGRPGGADAGRVGRRDEGRVRRPATESAIRSRGTATKTVVAAADHLAGLRGVNRRLHSARRDAGLVAEMRPFWSLLAAFSGSENGIEIFSRKIGDCPSDSMDGSSLSNNMTGQNNRWFWVVNTSIQSCTHQIIAVKYPWVVCTSRR